MILELTWSTLAFGGVVRAIYLAREALLDRSALGEMANGRRVLADWQVEHAFVGVLVYLFLLSAGLSALGYRFEVIPLHLRLLLASAFLTGTLLALVIRQERDAQYRKRSIQGHASSAAEQIDRIEATTADTNRMVSEDRKESSVDRPLEEADRVEGYGHRHPEAEPGAQAGEEDE